MSSHFNEKGPLVHVLEKKVEGMKEVHGTELPGSLAAGLDALRETALLLLILSFFLTQFFSFVVAILGWLMWKVGRASWLGWSRLERLHRLIEQEKFEIEHHRPQEREELAALYRAKGFEGDLLNAVLDVLMADQDRLLNVMLEEEMGLTLEAYEHPLKLGVGAFFGVIIGALLPLVAHIFFPLYGLVTLSFLLIGFGAMLGAFFEKNKLIPALVWNMSFAALTYGVIYFLR